MTIDIKFVKSELTNNITIACEQVNKTYKKRLEYYLAIDDITNMASVCYVVSIIGIRDDLGRPTLFSSEYFHEASIEFAIQAYNEIDLNYIENYEASE